MSSKYSTEADLLIGDVAVGGQVNPQKYIDQAADEIDATLGPLYVIPFVPIDPVAGIAPYSMLVLKNISNLLASGRLLLATGAGAEDTSLNAYGRSLVQEAQALLGQVAEGQVVIAGAQVVGGGTDNGIAGPHQINEDSVSGVDAFYQGGVNRPFPNITRPKRWSPGQTQPPQWVDPFLPPGPW